MHGYVCTVQLLIIDDVTLLLLQDTDAHISNETLIVDNDGEVPSSAVIADHTYGTDSQACGRMWLNDERTQGLDEIHINGGAHLAVHPDLLEA